MDAAPVPGPVPTIDKVAQPESTLTETPTKPIEAVPEAKPVEEKKDEPALTIAPPASEPAKLEEPPALEPPAEVSEPAASDEPAKELPLATTGVEEPKPILAEQSAPLAQEPEPVKDSVEEPVIPEEPVEPAKEKEPVVDKPASVNGNATKDVEMTGALEPEASPKEPTPVKEQEPAPEAAPQTLKPEVQLGEKRKADELTTTNGADDATETNDVEKPAKKKAKAGKPAVTSNGATPKKESPIKKLQKKVKKALTPVGRTERRTRSQGKI